MTEAVATSGRLPVAAVIVTHNQAGLALECARSLAGDVRREDIVVMVNQPASCSASDLAALETTVGSVVMNERALGYGANLNAGVRHLSATQPLVLLLNDDAIPLDGAIGRLVSCLLSHPSVGLAGPRIVDDSGRPAETGYRFPTVRGELLRAALAPEGLRRPLVTATGFHEPSESDQAVDWVLGAALLVRREAFDAVGGFDDSYFLYSEELDFAFRLRSRGWRANLCASAVVRHIGGASTGSPRYRRMLSKSRSKFIAENWSLGARLALVSLALPLQLWNLAYVLVRIVLSPRSGPAKWRLWREHWADRPSLITILRGRTP